MPAWIVSFFLFFSAPKPVGLSELWELARQRSHDTERAEIQLRRADSLVKGSRMLWLPRLSYSVQGAPSPTYRCVVPEAWMDAARPLDMTEREFRETFCVGTDRDDSITLNLDGYAIRMEVRAAMPLWTFGKTDYARAQANAMRDMSLAGVSLARQRLWLMVRKAYYARRAYLESQKLADEAGKLLEEAGARAELYEENGTISPTDLLRFKLGENDFGQRKLELDRLGELTAGTLRFLAGRPVEVRTSDPWEADLKRPPSMKVLLEKALASRPELRALEAARTVAIAKTGLARTRMYPDLGIFVRYRLALSNSDDPKSAYANDPLHGNSMVFGLGLEGQLDFSSQLTQMRLARLEQRESESRLAAARDALELELLNARQDLILAIDRLVLIERGRKLSRAWVMALHDQEKLGVVKPREMVDSLSALFRLQFNYWEARTQLENARAQLHLVTGDPVPGQGNP